MKKSSTPSPNGGHGPYKAESTGDRSSCQLGNDTQSMPQSKGIDRLQNKRQMEAKRRSQMSEWEKEISRLKQREYRQNKNSKTDDVRGGPPFSDITNIKCTGSLSTNLHCIGTQFTNMVNPLNTVTTCHLASPLAPQLKIGSFTDENRTGLSPASGLHAMKDCHLPSPITPQLKTVGLYGESQLGTAHTAITSLTNRNRGCIPKQHHGSRSQLTDITNANIVDRVMRRNQYSHTDNYMLHCRGGYQGKQHGFWLSRIKR